MATMPPDTSFPAPAEAREHFARRLAFETDPSDVHDALAAAGTPFVLVDARSSESFARAHIPGAVSLPHRTIDPSVLARLSRDVPVVTYCDGIGCNASTKAAAELAALGFRVKEMLGGLEWWRRDGFPVEEGAAR